MTCPTFEDLMLLSMNRLKEPQAESMSEHLQSCDLCRERFNETRRDHVELLRTYEALDRDHDALREQLMASLPGDGPQPVSTGRPARAWRRLGDWTMKNPTTRRAAGVLSAAAILTLLVSLFVSTGNGAAFARAIKHLRQTDTIVCRILCPVTSGGMQFNVEGKMYLSSDHGTRCDFNMMGMTYSSVYKPAGEPAVVVLPMMSRYMVIEEQDENAPSDYTKDPDAFLKRLAELTDDASELLGPDIIDGHEVTGFEIDPAGMGMKGLVTSARLYVDVETELPVKFELAMDQPAPNVSVKLVYDQFEWDVSLEAELFEPSIPEGYTQLNLRVPPVNEETLIEGLSIAAELMYGAYPDELNSVNTAAEVMERFAERAAEKGEIYGAGDAQFDDLGQKLLVIGRACNFYLRLQNEGREPEYFGKEITADDPDAVLLRWKLPTGELRVIYGDLTAETLPGSD